MKTHAQEVEEIQKGCGNEFEVLKYSKGIFKIRRNLVFDICKKNNLCRGCKSNLKGQKTAIRNELDFLEDKFIMLNTPEFDDDDAGMVRDDIKERITDCKNALAMIGGSK